jgi:hypothetical protein
MQPTTPKAFHQPERKRDQDGHAHNRASACPQDGKPARTALPLAVRVAPGTVCVTTCHVVQEHRHARWEAADEAADHRCRTHKADEDRDGMEGARAGPVWRARGPTRCCTDRALACAARGASHIRYTYALSDKAVPPHQYDVWSIPEHGQRRLPTYVTQNSPATWHTRALYVQGGA